MILRVFAAVVAAFVLSLNLAQAADAKFTVDTILGDWTDASRENRDVPYKIYWPTNAEGARPVVIFSHGLGGNRDGAEYLLRFLAENGYVTVAVQHKGSDTPAVFGGAVVNGIFDRLKMEQGLRRAITPEAAVDRFNDIPYAIDQLEAMNESDAKLRGRLDMSHIGMSGHSYGAITTMVIAGQRSGPNLEFSFADTRITAAIAYSPSKPRQGDERTPFDSIHIPTFHMTGTNDMNPLDATEPAVTRQIPYRSITAADKYLVVFSGGDHMIFAGRRIAEPDHASDAMFHTLIQKASLAYWDAYLQDNKDAKAYLTDGRFKQDLGANGTFEFQLR